VLGPNRAFDLHGYLGRAVLLPEGDVSALVGWWEETLSH
jgi:hypothetical protein